MFFTLELKREILLHPQYFSAGIKETIQTKLHEEVEGTVHGQSGVIVAVVNVRDISRGQIIAGRGEVLFSVKYVAIVFRPFKGEVLDAVVETVFEGGITVDVGPLQVFITKDWMGDEFAFDGSIHPPVFRNDTEEIRVGDALRIEVKGIRFNADKISVIGSIDGSFLGLMQR